MPQLRFLSVFSIMDVHLHLHVNLPLFANVVSGVVKIKAKGCIDMRNAPFWYVLCEDFFQRKHVGFWVCKCLVCRINVTVGESICSSETSNESIAPPS